mgnify:CR=1 FL=1|jgi:hypothetical protein
MKGKRKAKWPNAVYLAVAAGMVLYALPYAGQAGDGASAGLFWYAWLAFAVLIAAANANVLLMSEAKRTELLRIKRARMQRLERKLEQRLARTQAKKASARRGGIGG